jgi:hypothetical protein
MSLIIAEVSGQEIYNKGRGARIAAEKLGERRRSYHHSIKIARYPCVYIQYKSIRKRNMDTQTRSGRDHCTAHRPGNNAKRDGATGYLISGCAMDTGENDASVIVVDTYEFDKNSDNSQPWGHDRYQATASRSKRQKHSLPDNDPCNSPHFMTIQMDHRL